MKKWTNYLLCAGLGVMMTLGSYNVIAEASTLKQEVETSEESVESEELDEIIPGSNMSDAALVPLGTKIFGTIPDDLNGSIWFSFETGDIEDSIYSITVVNATLDRSVRIRLYDEYGTELTYPDPAFGVYAYGENGIAETTSLSEAEPDSVYYIQLVSDDPQKAVEYSMIVKNLADKTTAYKTVGSFSETGDSANALDGEVAAGTNQDTSAYLDLGKQVTGTLEPGVNYWFSFTTGETSGSEYHILFVDKTLDSKPVYGDLYDEYGNDLTGISNTYAKSNGAPATINRDSLEPNTTYYIRLESTDSLKKVDYTLVVKSPATKK